MADRRPRPLHEYLASPAQKIVAIAAGITTLIGLLLAVNRLIETFSGDDSPAPPRTATLDVRDRDEIGITWGRFIEKYPHGVPRTRYSRAQRAVHGLVLPVRITASGLAGTTATLRWTVVNPTGGAGDFDPPAWVPRSRDIRPDHSPAYVTAPVWIPPSEKLEKQIIRFSLIDDRGEELDREESEMLQSEPD